MKRILEKNNLMKLTALVLAIFLWFYVGIEQNPMVERYYTIPVSLENVPEGLSCSPDQQTVSVMIRDRQERLNAVQVSNIKATVDLSNAQLGQHSYKVHVRTSGFYRNVRVQPKEMLVTTSQHSGIDLPIEIVKKGEMAESVVLGDIGLSMNKVIVSGEAQLLNRVKNASVTVDITGITETQVLTLPVTLQDKEGNVIDSSLLTLNPSDVLVTVPVNKNVVEKTVPIHPITSGSPDQGYTLTDLGVRPNEVTIIGEQGVLDGISALETTPIPIGGKNNRSENASLILPEHVGIRGNTRVSVQLTYTAVDVEAKEDKETGTATLALPLDLIGKKEGQRIEIVGDQQIYVTYKGKTSQEELAKQITVTLDVSGLTAGYHDLPVKLNNTSTTQIEKFEPGMIGVTVS